MFLLFVLHVYFVMVSVYRVPILIVSLFFFVSLFTDMEKGTTVQPIFVYNFSCSGKMYAKCHTVFVERWVFLCFCNYLFGKFCIIWLFSQFLVKVLEQNILVFANYIVIYTSLQGEMFCVCTYLGCVRNLYFSMSEYTPSRVQYEVYSVKCQLCSVQC